MAEEILYERKPVDIKKVEKIARDLFNEALWFKEFILDSKRDPNMITRAVLYLSHTHTMPFMVEDTKWFHSSMSILIELACPNVGQTKQSVGFLKDINEGMFQSLFGVITDDERSQ